MRLSNSPATPEKLLNIQPETLNAVNGTPPVGYSSIQASNHKSSVHLFGKDIENNNTKEKSWVCLLEGCRVKKKPTILKVKGGRYSVVKRHIETKHWPKMHERKHYSKYMDAMKIHYSDISLMSEETKHILVELYVTFKRALSSMIQDLGEKNLPVVHVDTTTVNSLNNNIDVSTLSYVDTNFRKKCVVIGMGDGYNLSDENRESKLLNLAIEEFSVPSELLYAHTSIGSTLISSIYKLVLRDIKQNGETKLFNSFITSLEGTPHQHIQNNWLNHYLENQYTDLPRELHDKLGTLARLECIIRKGGGIDEFIEMLYKADINAYIKSGIAQSIKEKIGPAILLLPTLKKNRDATSQKQKLISENCEKKAPVITLRDASATYDLDDHTIESEVHNYLLHPVSVHTGTDSVLRYWDREKQRLPLLADSARMYFGCISSTDIPIYDIDVSSIDSVMLHIVAVLKHNSEFSKRYGIFDFIHRLSDVEINAEIKRIGERLAQN